MRKLSKLLGIVLVLVFLISNSGVAFACSIAGATGTSAVDMRPVMWKNRDSWGTTNCWQVYPFRHEANGQYWGAGDTYGDRFDFVGITDEDSFTITGEKIAWGGANERGLGLVQTASHTLSADTQTSLGYTSDMDPLGMDNGQLNNFILSRCETVDEVEQLLRDTNNGGGWNQSSARNTNSLVMVFDRYGCMATFGVCGTDFTRDNVTNTYTQDGNNHYSATHNDDKDTTNPPNGGYSGYDWRSNFSRVSYNRADGFPFFVDEHITEVVGNDVVNTGWYGDGIHDHETSSSAVKRWHRIGIRMDDPFSKDYRFMIQKDVNYNGIPQEDTVETLAKNIGELPAGLDKSTGFHLNRFVTTAGIVITGCNGNDPYDGKLTTIWVALGEPAVTVFVPIFPFAGEIPNALTDMYELSNEKRHLVYDYTDDDATGYSSGRNVDHSMDLVALTGVDPNNSTQSQYYGEGGIQKRIFASEDWAFSEYETRINSLIQGGFSDSELQERLRIWQNSKVNELVYCYEHDLVAGSGMRKKNDDEEMER